jgi:hypothetical protein
MNVISKNCLYILVFINSNIFQVPGIFVSIKPYVPLIAVFLGLQLILIHFYQVIFGILLHSSNY